jgi:hypothetical protein
MVREARRTEFRTQISQDVAAGVASNVDDFMVRIFPHLVNLSQGNDDTLTYRWYLESGE